MLPIGPKSNLPLPNVLSGSWKGATIEYRAHRVIVKLKRTDQDTNASLQARVADIVKIVPGGFVVRPPRASGRVLIALDPAADVLRIAEDLSKRPDVEYAEPDVVDHAAVIPSDTRYTDQWALPKVRAPDAWDRETGNAGHTLIGIIDSGISMSTTGTLDHPDLNDSGRYLLGTDFVDGGTPRDLCGHGTHVCGIAAAMSNNTVGVTGMNWGCHVYVCRTLDPNGNGTAADFADAVEEIVDYAVAHAVKVVINYSSGGGVSLTKHDACKYINDHGMILCAAAGNGYGGPVIWPAAYATEFDGVIAVGSTDSADHVSGFSNHGPEVTVVAPGSSILSTTPTYAVTIPVALNYDRLDGTSMATPLVTGLAALMWSRHPGFTNKKIRDGLIATAVKLGAGSFDNAWGNGRVDAFKAVTYGDAVFTPFTRFTIFTNFTLFTRFTIFTKFTVPHFTKLTKFSDPGPLKPGDVVVRPFVRFGTKLLDPEGLRLEHFPEFADVAPALARVGVGHLHELAASDPRDLGEALGYPPETAGQLVAHAQDALRQIR